MGGIRKHRSGWSDPYIIKDSFQDDKEIFYCTECKDELNKLFPRANYNESDADQWYQCRVCGLIVPIYELKKESRLKDFVETSDNPFDSGQNIVGLGNKSNDRKLTESQKRMKKLKERIEKEKDPDIKRELRKGNILTVIEDGLDY